MPGFPETTQVFGKDPSPEKCPEPIAIVGMACRWPGEASDSHKLWDLLESQRSGYRDFEDNKLNVNGFYHPNQNRPGSIYTKGGFFLKEDPKEFDHSFFGVTPVETMTMDPQQRKLLEVTYEAFENAGEPWEKFSGSKTGVFIGNFNYDHQLMQVRDADHPLPYVTTGGGITILSNRINYVFNLHGPSMTLDTACSSSMYALHLAVNSIRNGDCNAAIVGGSNLILGPEAQLFCTKLGAISPTSICHTFDDRADGYARADGFGAFYVKKLSDALANKDPIRAVIRATAINANGKTGGISHPSPEGQEAVIRHAYEVAGGLDPDLTGYFECHGTGTAVGDPLEVSAVGRIFAQGRKNDPLLIGSIKPNLGHSEPSSGIAGIMKAVLAIEHGQIPPTIGLVNPNPNIDFKGACVKVVQEMTPWPADKPIKRASINSFGYGGANAHCIIEGIESFVPGYQPFVSKSSSRISSETSSEADSLKNSQSSSRSSSPPPSEASSVSNTAEHLKDLPSLEKSPKSTYSADKEVEARIESTKAHIALSQDSDSAIEISKPARSTRDLVLLPFSGHDDHSLKANIAAISEVADFYDPADLAYTLGSRRSKFFQRSFAVADAKHPSLDLDEAKMTFSKSSAATQQVGFIFTGQGAQWPTMGSRLFAEFESYRRSIRKLDSILSKCPEPPTWTLEASLLAPAETSRVSEPELSQPLCTAVQVALVDLLSLWKVKPVATAGHSSGEIAAAYAAGAHTAEEAIIMAYYRGKVLATHTTKGLMLAVGLGPDDAAQYLEPHKGKAGIAAVNSPSSLTLSGDEEAIQAIKAALDDKKIFARIVQTGNKAYHSHHMHALGQTYEDLTNHALKSLSAEISKGTKQGPATWFSSVNPSTKPTGNDPKPAYWRKNLESPVLFSNAVENMAKSTEVNTDLLVEIGPHAALAGPLRQIRQALEPNGTKVPPCIGSIMRKEDNFRNILSLAGNLFVRNVSIDLGAVNGIETFAQDDKAELSSGSIIVDLPNYQYHYGSPIYYESRYNKEWRLRKHLRHDILGARQPGCAKGSPSWRNMLRLKDVPWLEDHKLLPAPIFPGAGYLAMAVEAMYQHHYENENAEDIRGFSFRNVAINSTMEIPDDDFGIETILNLQAVNLTITKTSGIWHEFRISSLQNEQWTEHVTGSICVETATPSTREAHFVVDPKSSPVDSAAWYEKFVDVGLGYGPTFQGLTEIRARPTENRATANVALNSTDGLLKGGESPYPLHPSTIDTCLQLALMACHAGQVENMQKAYVPVVVEEMSIWVPSESDQAAGNGYGQATGERRGLRGAYCRSQLFGKSGETLMDIKSLKCVTYDSNSADDEAFVAEREPYLRLLWKPDVDSLSMEQAKALFPPTTDAAELKNTFDKFNKLSAYVLVQIFERYSQLFSRSHEEHLQRCLDWVQRCVKRAESDELQYGQKALQTPFAERLQVIERLSEDLGNIVEAKLIKRLFDGLGGIFSGETSGLDIALKDNLLTELYVSGIGISGGYPQLLRAVDLVAHKRPSMNILEIGAGTGGATRLVLETLEARSQFKRYKEYTFTDVSTSFFGKAQDEFSECGGIEYKVLNVEKDPLEQGFEAKYDCILASQVLHATTTIAETVQHARNLLKPGGKLILLEITNVHIGTGLVLGTFGDYWNGVGDGRVDSPLLTKQMWQEALVTNGFSGIDILLDDHDPSVSMASVIVSTAVEQQAPQPTKAIAEGPQIFFAYDTVRPSFSYTLEDAALENGSTINHTNVGESESLPEGARVIVLGDLLESYWYRMDAQALDGLKSLFQRASSVVWVTAGGLTRGSKPLQALTSGIMRAIITEKPQTKIMTVDLDFDYDQVDPALAAFVLSKEQELQSHTESSTHDSEYNFQGRVVHISRLAPDTALSQRFRQQESLSKETELVQLKNAKPLGIKFGQTGILSTLYFKEDPEFLAPLEDDWIEIESKAMGLNVKDLAVALGRFDWNKHSTECAGVVSKVGRNVQNLEVGDRVFGAAPGNFGNFVRVRGASMQKMGPNDKFEEVASMPVAFMTAIYAFKHVGQLQKGESVLIQSATGGLGMAALQVAKHLGAEIYATVGNAEKIEILKTEFGIPEDHIFNSRDLGTPAKILEATEGYGIDVILCSAAGEAMQESWRAIAPMGRFVEVGRTDVIDHGKLNMEVFKRNATFSSFDLGLMNVQKPSKVAGLMAELADLYRQGVIKPFSQIETYDISKLEQAMMTFAKGTHTGKLVVTFNDPEAELKVRPTPEQVAFDSNAAYLLAGSLGGIGRSVSVWMAEHGARHLVYLSRSGADKQEAADLIKDLNALGVETQVIKCDIIDKASVFSAVREVQKPIKGVLQAAMVVNDAIFDTMSAEQYNSVVNPKVDGTVNLHEATLDQPLDFFTMTSSIVTMIGTATQGSYCAGNGFQDSFARYRLSQGLPAQAFALGMILEVGFVSQLPEVQRSLMRNGVYGTGQVEFLKVLEGSFASQMALAKSIREGTKDNKPADWTALEDNLSGSHLLTGLEPGKLHDLYKKGLAADFTWHTDARFGRLLRALEDLEIREAQGAGGAGGAGGAANLAALLSPSTPPAEVDRLLTEAVLERLSKLLFTPAEEMDPSRAVSEYGMDSMIAAELRNWFVKNLKTDVTFLELLDPNTKILDLVAKAKVGLGLVEA